jgi:hypothetical protein
LKVCRAIHAADPLLVIREAISPQQHGQARQTVATMVKGQGN